MKRLLIGHGLLMLTAFACAAAPAVAETLYKLVGKDGKVTYVQEAPKDFAGEVIRIDIDPKANIADAPKVRPPQPAATKAAASNEAALRQSKEKVERARKALDDAREHPGEEDIRFIGNVGRGTRPVPTDAYRERLARLEKDLKEAEDELARAEKAR